MYVPQKSFKDMSEDGIVHQENNMNIIFSCALQVNPIILLIVYWIYYVYLMSGRAGSLAWQEEKLRISLYPLPFGEE